MKYGNNSSMLLPKGAYCFDCRHYPRCTSLFGCKHTSQECDFSPSRFCASDIKEPASVAQQPTAGLNDGPKPCPDDCHYRNGRLCVLGPTNHCIRRAEDYYKPGTASAIAGR